jgi:hypothetical protein
MGASALFSLGNMLNFSATKRKQSVALPCNISEKGTEVP